MKLQDFLPGLASSIQLNVLKIIFTKNSLLCIRLRACWLKLHNSAFIHIVANANMMLRSQNATAHIPRITK